MYFYLLMYLINFVIISCYTLWQKIFLCHKNESFSRKTVLKKLPLFRLQENVLHPVENNARQYALFIQDNILSQIKFNSIQNFV